jgi:cyanophycin synthetase
MIDLQETFSMKIETIKTLRGANVFSHNPILVATLNLEELNDKKGTEILGLGERLIQKLGVSDENLLNRFRGDAFSEESFNGADFAQIVLNVCLELMDLAEIGTNRGEVRPTDKTGVYTIALEYKAEQATRFVLQSAVEFINSIIKSELYSLPEKIEEAKEIEADTELGPSGLAIVNAAEKRGIPWSRENED